MPIRLNFSWNCFYISVSILVQSSFCISRAKIRNISHRNEQKLGQVHSDYNTFEKRIYFKKNLSIFAYHCFGKIGKLFSIWNKFYNYFISSTIKICFAILFECDNNLKKAECLIVDPLNMIMRLKINHRNAVWFITVVINRNEICWMRYSNSCKILKYLLKCI